MARLPIASAKTSVLRKKSQSRWFAVSSVLATTIVALLVLHAGRPDSTTAHPALSSLIANTEHRTLLPLPENVTSCPLVTIEQGRNWKQKQIAHCCQNKTWRSLKTNNVTVTLPELSSHMFTVGCVLSICASLLIIVTYHTVKGLKRQPNSLIHSRSICDLALCLTWMGHFARSDCECFDNSTRSSLQGFFGTFFLIASELLYACLGIDLYLNIDNPFANFKTHNKIYRWGVFFISLAYAVAFQILSPQFEGRSFVPACWTWWHPATSGELSLGNAIFFYMPWVASYFISLIGLLRVSVFLGSISRGSFGTDETFAAQAMGRGRVQVLLDAKRYVVAHGYYWGALLIAYPLFVNLIPHYCSELFSQDLRGSPLIIACVVSFLFGARATENLIIWIPNLMRVRNQRKQRRERNLEPSFISREAPLPPSSSLQLEKPLLDSLSFSAMKASQSKGVSSDSLKGIPSGSGSVPPLPASAGTSSSFNRIGDISENQRTDEGDMEPYLNSFLKKIMVDRIVSGLTQLLARGDASTDRRFSTLDPDICDDFRTVVVRTSNADAVSDELLSGMRLVVRSARSKASTLWYFLTAIIPLLTLVIASVISVLIVKSYNGGSASADGGCSVTKTKTFIVSAAVLFTFLLFLFVIYLRFAVYVTPQAKGSAVVTEYLPSVFAKLRSMFLGAGCIEKLINSMVGGDLPKISLSDGRSGAFFFITPDDKFIIKTVTKEEAEVLLRIAPSMLEYFQSVPPGNKGRANFYTTLLAHVHGLFSFKLLGLRLYVIIMQNVMPTAGGALDSRYDLKGSWRARNASPPKLGQLQICAQCGLQYLHGTSDESKCRLGAKHTPRRLYKDNDLTFKVMLPIADAKRIRSQLRRDVEWLASMGIMDYSMLLGAQRKLVALDATTHSSSSQDLKRTPSRYVVRRGTKDVSAISTEAPYVAPGPAALRARLMEGPSKYYIGIIDYLQTWTMKKRMEKFGKMYVLGQRGRDSDGFIGVSAVDPLTYKNRFLKRVVEGLFPLINSIVEVKKEEDGDLLTTLDISFCSTYDDFRELVERNIIGKLSSSSCFRTISNGDAVSGDCLAQHFDSFKALAEEIEVSTVERCSEHCIYVMSDVGELLCSVAASDVGLTFAEFRQICDLPNVADLQFWYNTHDLAEEDSFRLLVKSAASKCVKVTITTNDPQSF